MNTALESHPLIGQTLIYRADQPPYCAAEDTGPGILVVGNGMTVVVVAAFQDWNGFEGLEILYVHCLETGLSTHVTPADLGLASL